MGTDTKIEIKDDIKEAMERLCKIIDDYQNVEGVIRQYLQHMVEKSIEDSSITVEAAPVDFFEGSICKEAEFLVNLSWDYKEFGPVIWIDDLKKICEHLNVKNFKIIPKGNTWELYIPFYNLGIAVGCDKNLLYDKED